MTKEEIIELIKENLTINVDTEQGCYGASDTSTFELLFAGEVISSDYLDIN